MSDSDAEYLQILLNMPVYLVKDSNKLEGRQYPYFDIKEVPITKDNA